MTERDQRLQEIRERYEASTPGEWESQWDFDWCVVTDTTGVAIDIDENDAAFIAHAHQDIPWLIAEIERLESLIGEPMMDQIVNRSKPVGSWDFKPTIRVKEGTDLSKIMDR